MTTALASYATPLDLWDPATFEHAQRLGNMFAKSVLIPEHLRGKIADVTIALMMARRLNEDPLIVMQNIFVVSGKAGWSAQYIIARANRAGVFKGRITWREQGSGENLEVTAFARLAENDEEVSFTVGMKMARDEGWTKNAKYKSMPQLMLRYRSATFLVRLYAPEVMLGIPTTEENEDVAAAQPARVVLEPLGQLGPVPAIEETGTRAGQLAAILDAVEEPAPPVVVPAAAHPPPPVVASVAPVAPPVAAPAAVAPVDEPEEAAPVDPAKAAQIARIEQLETQLTAKRLRRARSLCDLSPAKPQLKRMKAATLDAYQKALQSEADEADMMGDDE